MSEPYYIWEFLINNRVIKFTMELHLDMCMGMRMGGWRGLYEILKASEKGIRML